MACQDDKPLITMASPFSSFMKHQPEAVDKMTKCLDREMKAVKNWRHFATKLGADRSLIERLKWYGDFSPTIRVFDYLENVQPDLTVGEVKKVLLSGRMQRTDLSNLLDGADNENKIVEVLTPNLLDDIALGLDRYGGVVGNWSTFALMLGVPKNDLHQFEMRLLEDPTSRLFEYLETKKPQLMLKQLEEALRSVKRNNLANLLLNQNDACWGNQFVKDVIKPESELLRKIANELNRKVVGTGNWRNLANALGVPRDDYKEFEDPKGQDKRSATKEVLDWVKGQRPNITISNVIEVLTSIERMDVIEIITDALDAADLTQKMTNLRVNMDDHSNKQGLDKGAADLTQKMTNLTVNMDNDINNQGLDKADSSGPSGSSVSQVFLSYQWDLQSKVKELKEKLEMEGISCWMDIHQIGGGDFLRPEIEAAITNCKVFISCVSVKYCEKSDMGQREATLAHERKKRIIPVLFEDIQPWPPGGKLGLIFTDILYIKLPNGIIQDEKLQELLKQVRKFIQS